MRDEEYLTDEAYGLELVSRTQLRYGLRKHT